MGSKRSRGSAFQRRVKAWIEKMYPGCVVHNQTGSTVKTKGGWVAVGSTDILNCVDLLAVIPGKKPVFIQASLHGMVQKRLEDFEKIPWNFNHVCVQLWTGREDGRISIKQLGLQDVTVGKWDGSLRMSVAYELADIAEIKRGKLNIPLQDLFT